MRNNYGGKCIGLKNDMYQRKRKRRKKLNLLLILEIELGQHILDDIFNVNMIQNGLEKFLKFPEGSYGKVNLFTK